MKVKNECWCGKRGKRVPAKAGLNLCLKHYYLKLKQDEEKSKETEV
jgi:hypothetical protein